MPEPDNFQSSTEIIDNIAQSKNSETVISSKAGLRFVQSLKDLFEYRELFFAFFARNVKIRYKQTFLGVLWVILQPLITGVVFSAIFGLITGRYSGWEGLIFFMAGLVPWTSFQSGVQMASTSLETNANLVTKVYFPRMTVPASQVFSALVDFFIAFLTLLIFSIIAGVFTWKVFVWLIPLLFIQVCFALGLGIAFSILNAQYRDIKYTIPFVLQLGMFVTVLFDLEGFRAGEFGSGMLEPKTIELIYQVLSWNPMAAVIENYRLLFETGDINYILFGKGLLASVIVLGLGIKFFVSREKTLVDIL